MLKAEHIGSIDRDGEAIWEEFEYEIENEKKHAINI